MASPVKIEESEDDLVEALLMFRPAQEEKSDMQQLRDAYLQEMEMLRLQRMHEEEAYAELLDASEAPVFENAAMANAAVYIKREFPAGSTDEDIAAYVAKSKGAYELPEGFRPKDPAIMQCLARFLGQLAHVFKIDPVADVFWFDKFYNNVKHWSRDSMDLDVDRMKALQFPVQGNAVPVRVATSGEEYVLSFTRKHVEFVVRRALLAIRFNNKGPMGHTSLLVLIKNGVSTAQLIRLIKCIDIDLSMIRGALYPSDIKYLENQQETQAVLRLLRTYNPRAIVLDIGSDPYDAFGDMLGVTDVPYSASIPHVALLLYHALQRAYPRHGAYPHSVAVAYPNNFIAEWAEADVAPAITETITEIQLFARKTSITPEAAIERLVSSTERLVLFVEACALKYRLNYAKTSNLSVRKETSERVAVMWRANVNHLSGGGW